MPTPLTDAETLQHIKDCGWHMECAYARFQAHGDPSDRDAALLWLSMQQEAQRSLSPAAKAVREAEIQRAIDDGVGYFAAAGQRDRERLAA